MSHLGWPHLMSVALRLRVAEAILRSGESLESYHNDGRAAAVLDQFYLTADSMVRDLKRTERSVSDAAKEGAAIDAYFERVRKDLSEFAKTPDHTPRAKRLLETIVQSCSLRPCLACNASSPCEWTTRSGAQDMKRMATSGECLDAVKKVFGWATGIASTVYNGASRFPAPTLSTGHDAHNDELELAINAVTSEGPTPLRRRIVRMTFNPNKVWVPDYLSLAYVFMHECVAHSWCGVDIESPHAEASKNFHDGWMDCVAAEVLLRHLDEKSPCPIVASFADQIRSQTLATRALRFMANRPVASPDVWRWISGAEAFRTLWWLFDKTLELPAERVPDSLIRLSIELNASGISHNDRGDFVAAIQSRFVRADVGARLVAFSRTPQVADYIKEYSDSQDIRRFVRQITSLR